MRLSAQSYLAYELVLQSQQTGGHAVVYHTPCQSGWWSSLGDAKSASARERVIDLSTASSFNAPVNACQYTAEGE
ncbi:hypothetical protein C8Q77DRAFT_697810 [Trametes polyzona]|nr:hypothetical protein C8Q77DRAFT_697810 [Trametes polyzona]